MKRALVTGSAGFLGRHFLRALERRGYTVMGVDVASGRDAHRVFRQSESRYDLVVHCAAVEPHRAAIDSQPMHLARNLHLDSAMFEWAARTGQGRVLYISSSAAYPVRLQTEEFREYADRIRPLVEDDINHHQWAKTGDWSPDANYGWAKLTGERMAAAARDAGLPVTVVRPFSGYGEDQGENWPFGAFAARARRRENPFTIWGSGEQVRDWIHVDDVVAGALALVDNAVDGPVNLCTGVGTSMRELVGMMCAEVGYTPEIQLRPDQPAGVAYRVGDPALMSRWYTPQVSLAEGVKRALS